jgi:hypothetical protein
MWRWIKSLDRLLRGEYTQLPTLRLGRFDVPLLGLTVLIDLLGMIYGLCMGVFALTPGGSGHAMQCLASMVKTPALFLLTLVVTFPSLYVFNALVGSPLLILPVLRLLIASLAVTLSTLASIGPIVAFFSVTTTSYPFMVLLNVAVFAVAGSLGMGFLLQTLHRLIVACANPPAAEAPVEIEGENPGALEPVVERPVPAHTRVLFRVWVTVFGLVGAQMAWVLRPFIGHPNQPFAWLRPIHSNFFEAVVHTILAVVS